MKKKTSLIKKIFLGIVSIWGVLIFAVIVLAIYYYGLFTVYQDDQYKFSIRYPKTWQIIVHPKPTVAVVFLRPKDTAMDLLQENFSVTVQPLPNGVFTLDEFSDKLKAQMISVYGYRSNVNFVQYSPVNWDWHKGYEMSIEAPKPDNLKMVNAWTVYHNQAYILTYLGNIDKYYFDSVIVDAIIRSFRLQ